MPTVDELLAATVRLRKACYDTRESVVTFVTAKDRMDHPEGDAWLAIIETQIAAAHQNLVAVEEALKDCYFERGEKHARLAASLIFGCRYIAAHCVYARALYIPDEYLNFIRDCNDTFSQLNGYLQLLPVQIKEKLQ